MMENNYLNAKKAIWEREDRDWWQNYCAMVNSSVANRQIYAIPQGEQTTANADSANHEVVPGRIGSGRMSSNRFGSGARLSSGAVVTSGMLAGSGRYLTSGRVTTNRFGSGAIVGSGRLTGSERTLSSGRLIGSGRLVGSGRQLGSDRLVTSGRLTEQEITAGGRMGSGRAWDYNADAPRRDVGIGVLGLGYGIHKI